MCASLALGLYARASHAQDASVLPSDAAVTASSAPDAAAASAPTPQRTSGTPVLEGLSAEELEALRPIARRGIAMIVRDIDSGVRARITVLVRARAPMATVHQVITRVEDYAQIMDGVQGLEVTSRAANRIAFRFGVSLGVFDVQTTAMLHVLSPRRVNGTLLQSTLGPGGLRWDLYPDGADTLIAYSTWGDPSQGNWFLRTVARLAPSTIAAMQVSYDTVLALSAARRAEQLAGLRIPRRPSDRFIPMGALEAPSAGWVELGRNTVVGAVTMDDRQVMSQSAIALRVAAPPDAVFARLRDVRQYATLWGPVMQRATIVSEQDGVARFRSVVEAPVFRTEGEQDRLVIERDGARAVVWRGVSGDYRNDAQRYDVRSDGAGGSIVVLSGGADANRAGFVANQLLSRDPWMTPGYALAWKMVWLAAAAPRLAAPAIASAAR